MPNKNSQFRRALLREAIELMLSGDEKTGRAILRNYINATLGFQQLEEATSIPATSLMRMFGPKGNPSAKNLFGVLAAHLQKQEGVNFEIRPQPRLNTRFENGPGAIVYRAFSPFHKTRQVYSWGMASALPLSSPLSAGHRINAGP